MRRQPQHGPGLSVGEREYPFGRQVIAYACRRAKTPFRTGSKTRASERCSNPGASRWRPFSKLPDQRQIAEPIFEWGITLAEIAGEVGEPGVLPLVCFVGAVGAIPRNRNSKGLGGALQRAFPRMMVGPVGSGTRAFTFQARERLSGNINRRRRPPPRAGAPFETCNWLFVGSNAGGDRAAAMYSILQTAKLNDVNPEAYLTNILARIADGRSIKRISELIPWAYHPPVAQVAA